MNGLKKNLEINTNQFRKAEKHHKLKVCSKAICAWKNYSNVILELKKRDMNFFGG